jgi:glycosyltransferase involved in cell wall biosynthesis
MFKAMGKKKMIIFAMSMGSGGAERVISLLLPKLVHDYKVTLFLFFNNLHYPVPEEVDVITVSSKKQLNISDRILILPKVITKYRNLLKKENPVVSLSFLTQPNIINGMLKKAFPRTKFIVSERTYPSIAYRSSAFRYHLYQILIKKYYSAADTVFSNSKEINKDLVGNFGVKNKMKVLYNPVQTFSVNPYRLRDGQFQIISVGRLIPVKNHVLIPEALLLIEDSERNKMMLEIVGAGFLRDILEEFKAKINLSLPGNSTDVNKHLSQADCFVLSSNSEGFPNALLEAMAMGLPVISTHCKSGPSELLGFDESKSIAKGNFVEAEYGILVNVNDPEGLKKALLFLYDNPEKRQLYSELSFRRSQDFSLTNIYNELIDNIIM